MQTPLYLETREEMYNKEIPRKIFLEMQKGSRQQEIQKMHDYLYKKGKETHLCSIM